MPSKQKKVWFFFSKFKTKQTKTFKSVISAPRRRNPNGNNKNCNPNDRFFKFELGWALASDPYISPPRPAWQTSRTSSDPQGLPDRPPGQTSWSCPRSSETMKSALFWNKSYCRRPSAGVSDHPRPSASHQPSSAAVGGGHWLSAAPINRFPYEHQAIFSMTGGCSDQYVSFTKVSDSLYERRLLRSIDFLKTS